MMGHKSIKKSGSEGGQQISTPYEKFRALGALYSAVETLPVDKIDLLTDIADKMVDEHDPDILMTFFAWKADPVIDTILNFLGQLGEEERYEVLDTAEGLFQEIDSANNEA